MHRIQIARLLVAGLAAVVGLTGVGVAPAAAAAPRTLAGTVYLGAPDRPAQAGEVTVVASAWPTSVSVDTASDGTYRFENLPATSYTLRFTYNGDEPFPPSLHWGPAFTSTGEGHVDVSQGDRLDADLTFPAPGPLSGTVMLGDATHPAAAGEVGVYYRAGPSAPEVLGATTGADGRWTIPLLPAGTYSVRIDFLEPDRYQDRTFSDLKFWGGTGKSDLNATLMPAGSVSGTVFLGETGVPVPDGTTTVTVLNGTTRTFTVPVVGGTYRVGDLFQGRVTVTANFSGTGYLPTASVTTRTDAGAVVADVKLTPTYELSGTVFLDSTARHAGADEVKVTLFRGCCGTVVATTFTGVDGRYTFPAVERSGYYTLRFEYLGAENFPDWEIGESAPGVLRGRGYGSFGVSANLTDMNPIIGTGAAIDGKIVDTKKRPVAGIPVRIYYRDEDAHNEYVISAETTTLPNGTFRFRTLQGVPHTQWWVEWGGEGSGYTVERWGATSSKPSGKSIQPTENQIVKGIVGTAHRSGKISGVVSLAGYVIPGIDLATDVDLRIAKYSTSRKRWVDLGTLSHPSADGTFVFDDLVAGDYQVVAEFGRGPSAGYKASSRLSITAGKVMVFSPVIRARPWELMRDYNEDFWPDVLAIEPDGTLTYRTTAGEATHADPVEMTGEWTDPVVIHAGDMNSDAHADVLSVDDAGVAWLHPGDGAGGLGSRVQIATGWDVYTAIVSPGDLNRDGWSDVLARSAGGTMYLLKGNGQGGWLTAPTKIATGWKDYSEITPVGDFNSDGRDDVIARDKLGRVWLYRGNGTGKFLARTRIYNDTQKMTAIFSVGDVSGDYCPDILMRTATGTIKQLTGSCKGKVMGVDDWSYGWSDRRIIR